ncbi:hypothetical protein [uncultured Arthrobacter sp.]|uniref:hypothetical protein n=1 Tax=uncultured Arthrobacter sp. TaxID=114050 RepID=UPI002631F434|nr:hypothetical protein [uncultured Arthrobacter sp.]
MIRTACIGWHDETPDNTVLAVFETHAEAAAPAEEIQDRFEGGVIFSSRLVDTRYVEGTRHIS